MDDIRTNKIDEDIVILHRINVVTLSWCPCIPKGPVPNKRQRLICIVIDFEKNATGGSLLENAERTFS